jgi:fibronectin type 3 domain-containing protein
VSRLVGIAALAALVAGCGGSGSGTYVTLSIERLGGGADVASIDLALDLDGKAASMTLREHSGGPISFPTSVTLSIGKGEGTLSLTAIARDASGAELARDSSSTTVKAGSTSHLSLSLHMGEPDDLGSDDMTPPDLAGADMTVIDMAVPIDMTPPPDLTLPIVHDLSVIGTPPSAPTGVSATAGDTTASVSWSAPSSSGSSSITGYTVTASPGGATMSTGASTLNTLFTGLTNGTTYAFTVTAANNAGNGAASAPSNNVIPAGVPLAPTNVAAVVNGVGSLSVSWTAAGANGSAVQGYVVTPSAGAAKSPTASPVTFSGLTVGTTYTFTVTAHNAIGTGAASSPSTGVAAADVPGQPTNIVATYQSDGTVLIAWQTPNSNFSSIIDYQIGSQVGPTYTASGNPFTRPSTNLVVGNQYTFYVTPRNAAGSGPLGSSNQITYGAASAPATPQSWTVSGSHYAACYFFGPSVGATSYNIYYNTLQSKVFTNAPFNTTMTDGALTGLNPNVTYYIAVTAVNAQGESPPSPILSAATDAGIGQPNCSLGFGSGLGPMFP